MTDSTRTKIRIREPQGLEISRKDEYDGLNQLVNNVETPFVLALDGDWGAGKSKFIQQWILSRGEDNKTTFFLDAWESDYVDDPLIPLLELLTCSTAAPNVQKSIAKIKEIAPKLIKSTIRSSVKFASFGLVDTGEIESALSSVIANTSADLLDGVIDSFTEQKVAIQLLKGELSAIVNSHSTEQNVVIFIDELDRCRPDYAVLLLERLKHLFGIEGLVFVVSTSTSDLANAVRGVYGSSYDGERYLKRFFDVQYQINSLPMSEYIVNGCKELKIYSKISREYIGTESDLNQNTADILSLLAQRHSVTFRDLNQLLAKLAICISTVQKPSFQQYHCLVTLLFCKEFLPDDYQALTSELSAIKINKSIHNIYGGLVVDERWEPGVFVNICHLIFATVEKNEQRDALLTAIRDYWANQDKVDDTDPRHRSLTPQITRLVRTLENSLNEGVNEGLFTYEMDEIIDFIHISARISV
jgi:hypothetical protein